MPVYLNEDMVGTDPELVGFPHVLLCMAVVCETGRDLYGVHIGDTSITGPTVDWFKRWLNGLGVSGADMRAIYASANLPVRYGKGSDPAAAWKSEMNDIAKRLGYRGRVCGFDTSVIAPKDGTYIEFRNDSLQSVCRIFYKSHQQMNYENRMLKLASTKMARIDLDKNFLDIVTRVEAPASIVPDSILKEADYSSRLLIHFTE